MLIKQIVYSFKCLNYTKFIEQRTYSVGDSFHFLDCLYITSQLYEHNNLSSVYRVTNESVFKWSLCCLSLMIKLLLLEMMCSTTVMYVEKINGYKLKIKKIDIYIVPFQVLVL